MAPRSKFTAEQVKMMEEYREQYLECQAVGDYTPFWAPFFEDYHARWPEREHVFPDVPLDIDLTPEQKVVNASMVDARKKQLMHRFRNMYGNYSAKRKLKAQTTEYCRENPAEAYYKTRIKLVVDVEIKVLAREAGLSPMTSDEEDDDTSTVGSDVKQVLPKTLRLSLIKKHTRALFANETPEIKAEVADFIKQWSENRKKSSSEDDDISFTENIEKLPNVLADIFAGLAKQTGWAFSVLMGGPSPGMSGKIQVESFHVGRTAMGNTFNLAYSDFNECIMRPYADFTKHAFPDAAGKGTPSPGPSKPAPRSFEDTTLMPIDFTTTSDTSLLPSTDTSLLPLTDTSLLPSDDQLYDMFSTLDISGLAPSFENDGPILPMPDGYTPPTTNSPSLESFNSALFGPIPPMPEYTPTVHPLSSLESTFYDGLTPHMPEGHIPTAHPSSSLESMDLFNAPLGPNWPGLPFNQPVMPTISLSLHPSATLAATLASKTPVPLPTTSATAAATLASKTPVPLPTTPAATLTLTNASKTPVPLPTTSATPAATPISVARAEHIMSETRGLPIVESVDSTSTSSAPPVIKMPAVTPVSVVPAAHIASETPALSIIESVDPTSTSSAPPVVKTPTITPVSVAPAEHTMSETPALTVVKLVHPASPLPALPTVEQPLMHLVAELPIVQPPPNLTQPAELSVGPSAEPAATKGARQHESLVLRRSK
ncbi:uncharacterized protein EDB93DRAFT_1250493 [Suillus bovinus]|uniref:uncharacterized protein n=1 Tax=Suillus bovinus TaxID=48563 RepID=UPI001B883611|nr:uncharacterized protein EDB93DRAFT_1250493 [Suillus bovinus]KAG2147778.1 hypothetical protein EDB93DRAFT_1250493 [Suillus bovinus]